MLPQLPFSAPASRLGCVYRCQKHSAQRAVSAVCCRVGCALVPLIVAPLCLVLVGQSYELVVISVVEVTSKSFTQIGILKLFWGKFFFQRSLGDFFYWNFRLNYFNANTRVRIDCLAGDVCSRACVCYKA